MNELPGFAVAIPILIALVLAILALLMPLFVFVILGHVRAIQNTLERMEHMMRHGK